MTGLINPDPIVYEEVAEFENDFLSPSKLQEISGSADLSAVHSIEILVNAKNTTLGNFGKYLPSLQELIFNNSFIPCIRDIGTAFQHLVSLQMSKCHLNDVDGIATLQKLEVLDISFNNVTDISPISFLESLKVLNASHNGVADIEQIDYLSLMFDLVNLTLSENPVCHAFEDKNEQLLQEYVIKKLPNLQKFNGQNCSSDNLSNESEVSTEKDLCTIDESSLHFCSEDKSKSKPFITPDAQDSRPQDLSVSYRKHNDFKMSRPFSASEVKLGVATTKTGLNGHSPRPGSSGSSQNSLHNDDSSALTFGSLFFGNPLHAIKDRKKTPPSPLIAKLSKEPENSPKPRPRPATAIGLRRSVKRITDDQLKILESDIRKSKLSQNERVASAPTANHYHLKSPSPPKTKVYSL